MKELIEHIDYYINEDGDLVLTKKYHLDRGYCCGNGCLHCPYQYENMPEPGRTKLRLTHELKTAEMRRR